jgi:hypothetical protein
MKDRFPRLRDATRQARSLRRSIPMPLPVQSANRSLGPPRHLGDQAISVTMHWDTACHADGGWKIWSASNEKDIQWMQTTLADLKAKIEGADQRH